MAEGKAEIAFVAKDLFFAANEGREPYSVRITNVLLTANVPQHDSPVLLAVRRDTSEDVVSAVTKLVFENIRAFQRSHIVFSSFSTGDMVKDLPFALLRPASLKF